MLLCSTSFYDRISCPAQSVVCYNFKKKGHFARVCKSRKWQSTAPGVSAIVSTNQLYATQLSPACLSHATVTFKINEHKLSTAIDTGSLLSFINKETMKTIGLRMTRKGRDVTMATTDLHCNVGSNVTNLSIGSKNYSQVKFRSFGKSMQRLASGKRLSTNARLSYFQIGLIESRAVTCTRCWHMLFCGIKN